MIRAMLRTAIESVAYLIMLAVLGIAGGLLMLGVLEVIKVVMR